MQTPQLESSDSYPGYLSRTIRRYQNARAVVQQIRNGEWAFQYNSLCDLCCVAHRGEREMWVGNGGFFLDVDHSNAFGLIFRHYVWWAAARKARHQEDRRNQFREIPDLSI